MSSNAIIYENSNYQVYLEPLINFKCALWEKHIQKVKENKLTEVSWPGATYTAGIEEQQWDSDILKINTGSVTDIFYKGKIKPIGAKAFVNVLEKKIEATELKFLKIRISANEETLLDILKGYGWYVVDSLNIYCSRLDSLPGKTNKKSHVTTTTENFELNEALNFFENEPGLFSFARMHADRNISSERANSFYRDLFKAQFLNQKSFRVGLKMNNKLIGLAIGNSDNWLRETFDLRLGYLWLIAISKGIRGKGLGSLLLNVFLNTAKKHVNYLEIGTQVENQAANKLYQSAGFPVMARTVTLHKWKN